MKEFFINMLIMYRKLDLGPFYTMSSSGEARALPVRKVMFILTEMQDVVRIEPWKFSEDTSTVVVNTLNKKFANKVCATYVI